MDIPQLLNVVEHCAHRGQWQRAEQLLIDGISEHPDQLDLINALAIIYFQQGKSVQALLQFERAAVLSGTAEAWCNLASALCDFSEFERALKVLTNIDTRFNDNALLAFTRARALKGTAKPIESMAQIQQAIAVDSQDTDFRFFRANLAVELDQWDLAIIDLRYLTKQSLSPPQRLMLAGLHLQTGQFTYALKLYQDLVTQFPDYFDAWLGLASANERANYLPALEDALGHAQRLVKNHQQGLALKHMQAKLALRSNRYDEAVALLQEAWQLPTDNVLWKSQVGFDLAQSLDKAKHYEHAWQVFGQAHAMRNRLMQDSGGDRPALDFFAMLEKPISGIWPFRKQTSELLKDPVFVVGFPRSGTTLLEQILDAQPDLVSFDEQPFIAKTLVRFNQLGYRYPEQLESLSVTDIELLRSDYFDQARVKVPELGKRRLVDKNPLNWARLPLIRALFPEAQIILALRHPCDVILSCYMQNLRSTVLGGAFSDFGRIADLYIAIADFWQRTSAMLDANILISRYEDLVANPEQSTRLIASFLDLPWHADWLKSSEHAKHKALIHTPSYAQVLEPLNNKAVGRWRNYRPFIAPEIIERLKPAVQAMGYRLD